MVVARTHKDMTPLHFAVVNGYKETVQVLCDTARNNGILQQVLEHGAYGNLTPLMLAVCAYRHESARVLCKELCRMELLQQQIQPYPNNGYGNVLDMILRYPGRAAGVVLDYAQQSGYEITHHDAFSRMCQKLRSSGQKHALRRLLEATQRNAVIRNAIINTVGPDHVWDVLANTGHQSERTLFYTLLARDPSYLNSVCSNARAEGVQQEQDSDAYAPAAKRQRTREHASTASSVNTANNPVEDVAYRIGTTKLHMRVALDNQSGQLQVDNAQAQADIGKVDTVTQWTPYQLAQTLRFIGLGASIQEHVGEWEKECNICSYPLPSHEKAKQAAWGNEIRKLSCRHRFHEGCLKGWCDQFGDQNRVPKCPVCRKATRPVNRSNI